MGARIAAYGCPHIHHVGLLIRNYCPPYEGKGLSISGHLSSLVVGTLKTLFP